MDDQNDGKAVESRPPTLEDLVQLCRSLNEQGAKYVVIGGMAVIQAGFVRATADIDLLVDVDPANQEKIRAALMHLPDQAIREVRPDDLDRYVVVRVADEIVVDLMKSACGIEYDEASQSVVWVEIREERIPFASPELLLRLKQSVREKDKLDRMFLEELLRSDD